MLDLSKEEKGPKGQKDKDESTTPADGDDDINSPSNAASSSNAKPPTAKKTTCTTARPNTPSEDMLDRVMGILHAQNPDLIEKKRRTMKPPQLTRVGTKTCGSTFRRFVP
eukprot:g6210.t1 g6210   contig20:1093430-1093759(+)